MVLSEVKKNGTYHVKQLRGFGDVHRHLEDMGLVWSIERGIGENSQRC